MDGNDAAIGVHLHHLPILYFRDSRPDVMFDVVGSRPPSEIVAYGEKEICAVPNQEPLNPHQYTSGQRMHVFMKVKAVCRIYHNWHMCYLRSDTTDKRSDRGMDMNDLVAPFSELP